jgi:hypothetical protein
VFWLIDWYWYWCCLFSPCESLFFESLFLLWFAPSAQPSFFVFNHTLISSVFFSIYTLIFLRNFCVCLHSSPSLSIPFRLLNLTSKTKKQVSVLDSVQDIRAYLEETPESAFFTSYHFELNGKPINEYGELSEIPELKDGSVLHMVEGIFSFHFSQLSIYLISIDLFYENCYRSRFVLIHFRSLQWENCATTCLHATRISRWGSILLFETFSLLQKNNEKKQRCLLMLSLDAHHLGLSRSSHSRLGHALPWYLRCKGNSILSIILFLFLFFICSSIDCDKGLLTKRFSLSFVLCLCSRETTDRSGRVFSSNRWEEWSNRSPII